jgi:rhomboid domain-containing protein 1
VEYQKALEIRKRLAPDSLTVATSYNNIGLVLYSQGDLEGALVEYQKALEVQKRLAPDSLTVATSYNNIGAVLRSQGNLEGALVEYRKALEIQKRLAPDSLDLAASYHNIGEVLKSQGNLKGALVEYQKALEIEERLAPDSLAVAMLYNNIGSVLDSQGNLKRSQVEYQKALEIRKRLAPNSLDVAKSYNNIGEVLYSIWSIPLATLGIMALCIFVYAAQFVLDLELHHYTMNPHMIIHLQEYYRFITCCLFHDGLMHIGMNMMSAAAISTMLEKRLGTLQQIMTIAWAMLLTSSLYTLVSLFLHLFLGWNNLMSSHSVGFLGVLFHLLVMECNMTPHRSQSVFGFLSVPAYLYPWALLVALQMFMPNLSFAGHLSGILTGTLQSFGAFDFLFVSQAYLQEMEKWHSLSHLTTLPNFVATPALLETTVQQHDSPVRLLATARSVPDSLDVATSYNNNGLVFYSQGNLPAALASFRKALEIRK